MGTRLYVGNLPYGTDDKQLRALFDEVGHAPREVRIITDRTTGQSRGFAFVEMHDGEAAQAVITALNGRAYGGRTLTVNEARERGAAPERRNGGPPGGGFTPREGRPPSPFGAAARPGGSFGAAARPGGGGPGRPGGSASREGGDRDRQDRDRDRDRFERKKAKRKRDYGDDGY